MTEERKSFEYSILESWEGWDEIETASLQFYDCKIRKDVIIDGVDYDALYDVYFDLQKMQVELHTAYGDSPSITLNIKLVV